MDRCSRVAPADKVQTEPRGKKIYFSMISGIILTHGDLCFGLKDTLQGIMGAQEGLAVISNSGMGREELVSALQRKVNEEANPDGVIIFVDMFGTSCWQTAKRAVAAMQESKKELALISGVNLPMLVKFFSERESLPISQLVPLLQQEGEKGIRTEG